MSAVAFRMHPPGGTLACGVFSAAFQTRHLGRLHSCFQPTIPDHHGTKVMRATRDTGRGGCTSARFPQQKADRNDKTLEGDRPAKGNRGIRTGIRNADGSAKMGVASPDVSRKQWKAECCAKDP